VDNIVDKVQKESLYGHATVVKETGDGDYVEIVVSGKTEKKKR
jgi:hypothetical protein